MFGFLAFVNAQNLSLGPTAGFGHSFVSHDNDDNDNEFWPSYNAGAKLVYSFVSHWGISAAVKFSGEGAKQSALAGNDEYEYRYRANYIRVPLEGIYFFGELGDAVRPKLAIGPSFGFLIGGESETKINGTVNNTVKTKDVFDSFDFGLTGAAGANFRLGGDKWLNTDITYYHGLTDISTSPVAGKIKNRNIGLNVGILFPIGTVK